jgi:hypothetical protein
MGREGNSAAYLHVLRQAEDGGAVVPHNNVRRRKSAVALHKRYFTENAEPSLPFGVLLILVSVIVFLTFIGAILVSFLREILR